MNAVLLTRTSYARTDPRDPAIHTNTVEGMWAHSKAPIARCTAPQKSYVTLMIHLQELIWRRAYPIQQTFGNILYWIRHYNPVTV